MEPEPNTALTRRIRWRLTIAEQSLDNATQALNRARESAAVDPLTRAEIADDITLLRSKLDTLAHLLGSV